MLVTSLTEMEDLVKKSRSLRWDGWDVIHFYKSETAWMSKRGTFHKGSWYMNRRMPITELGWNIPEKVLVNHR
jgi:hypothetical protein